MEERIEWLDYNLFSSSNFYFAILKNSFFDRVSIPRSFSVNKLLFNFIAELFFAWSMEVRIINPITIIIRAFGLIAEELFYFFISETSVQWLEILTKIKESWNKVNLIVKYFWNKANNYIFLHQRFFVFTVVSIGVHKSVGSEIIWTISSGGEIIISSFVEHKYWSNLSNQLCSRNISKSRNLLFKIGEVIVAAVQCKSTSHNTLTKENRI